jgi:hypothetical protein
MIETPTRPSLISQQAAVSTSMTQRAPGNPARLLVGLLPLSTA